MAKMSARIIKAAMEYKESCRDKWIDPDPHEEMVSMSQLTAPPSEAIRWRIHLDYNGRRSY
jgi:hypothetical protein